MTYNSGRIFGVVNEALSALDDVAKDFSARGTGPLAYFTGTLAVPTLDDDDDPTLWSIVYEDDRHYAEQLA